jgi:hypothetical protein
VKNIAINGMTFPNHFCAFDANQVCFDVDSADVATCIAKRTRRKGTRGTQVLSSCTAKMKIATCFIYYRLPRANVSRNKTLQELNHSIRF